MVTEKNLSQDLLKGQGRIIFPENFLADRWIDRFVEIKNSEKNSKTIKHLDSSLKGKNFSMPSDTPVLGKTYGVGMKYLLNVGVGVKGEEIFTLMSKSISGFCNFGIYGLSLFQLQQPSVFPKGNPVIAFASRDCSWKDSGGNHRILSIERTLASNWKIGLSSMDVLYEQGDVLFYIYLLEDN